MNPTISPGSPPLPRNPDCARRRHLLHFLGIKSSSVDGGRTWFHNGFDGLNYRFAKRTEGRFLGIGSGMLLTLSDDDWSTRDYLFGDFLPEFERIDFVDADLAYAIADGGHVFKTENAGFDWTLVHRGDGQGVYDIRAISADIVVTSTEGDGLSISRNGGATFTRYRLPNNFMPGRYHALDVRPDGTILLHTSQNFFRLHPDGTVLAIGMAAISESLAYNRLTFSSDDTGILYLRAQDPVYRTTDGGMTWTELPALLPDSRNLHWDYAYFTDAQNGFIGSSNEQFRTSDGGLTWSKDDEIPAGHVMLQDAEGTLFMMQRTRLYRYTSEVVGWEEMARLPCGLNLHAQFRPGRNQIVGVTTGGVHRINIDIINPVWEVHEAAQLRVYPNPTAGLFNLELPMSVGQSAVVQVADLAGRTVYRQELRQQAQVDLSQVKAGIYLVSVYTAEGVRTRRVVVQ